jgi:hypothetical protein
MILLIYDFCRSLVIRHSSFARRERLMTNDALDAAAVLVFDDVQAAFLLRGPRPTAGALSSPSATGRVHGQQPMLG